MTRFNANNLRRGLTGMSCQKKLPLVDVNSPHKKVSRSSLLCNWRKNDDVCAQNVNQFGERPSVWCYQGTRIENWNLVPLSHNFLLPFLRCRTIISTGFKAIFRPLSPLTGPMEISLDTPAKQNGTESPGSEAYTKQISNVSHFKTWTFSSISKSELSPC